MEIRFKLVASVKFLCNRSTSLVLCFLVTTVVAFGQNTSVYFNTDKSNLDAKAKSELDALLKFVAEHPGGKLTISGHTDSDASNEYNDALSQRRVTSVINYLTAHSKEKLPEINRSALGETKPVTANGNEKDKALNRRVELNYEYPKTVVTETKTEVTKANIQDLYELLLPDFQEHCIDNSRDTLLSFSQGTLIKIPADAFTRKPKGCVTISVREALSKSDMIIQNLNTEGSEGTLISGGMLEIKATDTEGELFLKSDKLLSALLPTDNVLDNADTYYGTRDTTHQENIHWTRQKNDKPGGTTLPVDYWINCYQAPIVQPTCDRCKFFCRIGRFSQGMKGLSNSTVHNANKEFRKCQKKLRKNKKKTLPLQSNYCISNMQQLQRIGISPDSTYFLKIYEQYMKDRGLKYVAETIESLRKDQEARQKAYAAQLKEQMRQDSIRRVGYNAIGIGGFGYINCDYFPREKNKQLIDVSTNLSYGSDVDCKMIFTEIRSIMASYPDGNSNFSFRNVPKGEKVWLFAIKYDGDQAYLFLKDMKIGDPVPEIEFKKVTLSELKGKLREMD